MAKDSEPSRWNVEDSELTACHIIRNHSNDGDMLALEAHGAGLPAIASMFLHPLKERWKNVSSASMIPESFSLLAYSLFLRASRILCLHSNDDSTCFSRFSDRHVIRHAPNIFHPDFNVFFGIIESRVGCCCECPFTSRAFITLFTLSCESKLRAMSLTTMRTENSVFKSYAVRRLWFRLDWFWMLSVIGQHLWDESELFRLRQVMEQLYQCIDASCVKHDFLQ